MLWRLVQSPARYSECLLPVSPNGSNSRMLICIACRNGDVPAKICVKSLEKKGVSVLHENLRLKRKERGLSQEELASRLHVVRQTISKWEKEMSVPDSEQLIKIVVILETTVSELLVTKVENEEEPDRLANDLFANLSTVRIKSGESYNDAPMTDKFIKIIFEVSDGLSGCIVYVFEDENGFFIEQPYNGIFSIEEKQYAEIFGTFF